MLRDSSPREFVGFIVKIRRDLAPGWRSPEFRQALVLAAVVDRLPVDLRSSRFGVDEIATLIVEFPRCVRRVDVAFWSASNALAPRDA